MINNDRIVPVTKIDLLSLYGLILALTAESAPTALTADNAEGNFTVGTDNANVIANEPVKALNFTSAVSAATVYFVAAYNYAGFTINGTATETAGVTVDANDSTLYSATLADGTVTIAKIGF